MKPDDVASRARESRDGDNLLLWDAGRLTRARPQHFDPDWWADRGELRPVVAGRGAAWFVHGAGGEWVLRHYRRGGLVARWIEDHYLWTGIRRTRAFAEWRLLAVLAGQGLPVPAPVAARVRRQGIRYAADLITVRIPDSESLAQRLGRAPLPAARWQSLGHLVARFHEAGACHHDLNAHNILVDGRGRFWLIDFDRGRLRRPGRWRRHNLARLRRSLDKLAGQGSGLHFRETDWQALHGGYLMGPSAH
ncbi:3-deoxy-D-manno-octulosonic-acid kinase [Salinisphaera sp. PC39]